MHQHGKNTRSHHARIKPSTKQIIKVAKLREVCVAVGWLQASNILIDLPLHFPPSQLKLLGKRFVQLSAVSLSSQLNTFDCVRNPIREWAYLDAGLVYAPVKIHLYNDFLLFSRVNSCLLSVYWIIPSRFHVWTAHSTFKRFIVNAMRNNLWVTIELLCHNWLRSTPFRNSYH